MLGEKKIHLPIYHQCPILSAMASFTNGRNFLLVQLHGHLRSIASVMMSTVRSHSGKHALPHLIRSRQSLDGKLFVSKGMPSSATCRAGQGAKKDPDEDTGAPPSTRYSPVTAGPSSGWVSSKAAEHLPWVDRRPRNRIRSRHAITSVYQDEMAWIYGSIKVS